MTDIKTLGLGVFSNQSGTNVKIKIEMKSNKNLPNSDCENSNLTSSLSFSVRALSSRICSFSSSDSSVCIFILKSVISRSCRSFSSLRSFSARSRCSRSCRYRVFIFRRYFFNHLAQKELRGNANSIARYNFFQKILA